MAGEKEPEMERRTEVAGGRRRRGTDGREGEGERVKERKKGETEGERGRDQEGCCGF